MSLQTPKIYQLSLITKSHVIMPGAKVNPLLSAISANDTQPEYDAGQKLFQSLNREIVPEHPNTDGSTNYINKPIPFSTLLHSQYCTTQPS